MSRCPRCIALSLSLLWLQGCLSTWIRMEDGTVLSPGKSDFAIGIGAVPRSGYDCGSSSDAKKLDKGGVVCIEWQGYRNNSNGVWSNYGYDTTPAPLVVQREPHVALLWNLGVLGPFGPFTGLEIGVQAEAATYPVSQEYKLSLGLPGSDSVWAHSLIAGWGTGAWADNSWFLQYAASRGFGAWRTYASLRGTLQATQLMDIVVEDHFAHKRSWDFQAVSGVKIRLGEMTVLPDWMVLEATVDLGHLGYPGFSEADMAQKSGVGVAVATGMGWSW